MYCIVENCKSSVFSKSMCQKHYTRDYRYGDINFFKQNKNQDISCIVDSCNNKPLSKNLCSSHYARWKRNGNNFNQTVPLRKITKYHDGQLCLIPNCKNIAKIKNFCKKHYQHQSRHRIDFSLILDDFANGCAVCGSVEALCLDHDHSVCQEKNVCSKCYRGILCRDCNFALGQVKESPERLKKLAKYIESHSKK